MATTETFEERQARWETEIAATPTPEVGDWVRDWGGEVFEWSERNRVRLSRHRAIYRYIAEIRRRDGFVWVRPC